LLAELQLRAFSRGQEQAADAFGLQRMTAAGYAPSAAVEIWQSAAVELGDRRASVVNRLLATHPAPAARRDALLEEIAALPVQPARRSHARYQAALAPHRAAFLADEVRLRLPTETLRLFQQLEEQHGLDADLAFYRGEVHRLRGWQDDQHLALRSYAEALRLPQSPAAAHRSIGLISRAQGDWQRARAAFVRYLITRIIHEGWERRLAQAFCLRVLRIAVTRFSMGLRFKGLGSVGGILAALITGRGLRWWKAYAR
jgi:beta-barrel assembly-enhancing protease